MVKIGAKNGFLAHFVSFNFVYAPLHPMSYAPRFCQMKDVIKIYIYGKFHQYSICGCKVKNFQSFSHRLSLHEMVPFGVFFGPLLPQILFNFAEILTKGILQ